MPTKARIAIDFVTHDPAHDEFALYFVEDGPWNLDNSMEENSLRQIQDKVFDAMDAAIDGGLATALPDSLGKKVRIQIDSPSGCPDLLQELVTKINEYIQGTAEYASAINHSTFIAGLRVVTGKSMGRFEQK